tara:strand:+ start:95 stop:754 length:660 start_codon:yes stop_codon:yes gene_type:complete
MKGLKDNANRSKKLIEILKVSLWLNIVLLPLYIWQYFIYSKYNFDPLLDSWEFYPEGYDEPTFDIVLGITGIIYLVVFIICTVRFIKWFRRAYFNIEAAGLNIDNSESTAAWAWFVPIYNLFAPYQIMKEIWVKTQKTYTENIKPINNLIILWWVTWITSSILDNLTDGIGSSPISNNLELVSIFSIVSVMIMIFSNYLVIEVVKQVSVFEKSMYSSLK